MHMSDDCDCNSAQPRNFSKGSNIISYKNKVNTQAAAGEVLKRISNIVMLVAPTNLAELYP